MGRRRGGRTLTPASLRGVIAEEIGKAMTGAPRTAANPTAVAAQGTAVASTPDTFGQLAAMMRSMVGYRADPMKRDPRDSGPFGPMHPMQPDPISPARADTGRPEPWVYEYPVAWNIPGQGERLMPWKVLREAARNIDVIRRCIEIRKSRVKPAPWSWDISPRAIEDAYRKDRSKGHDDIAAELRDQFRADINRLTEFWRNPWRAQGLDFGQWAGGVMEGRLKYDAAVLYPRYNLGGDTLLGFEIIDATTIKPLLDYRGARPEPPFPAYQQILYGFPRGEWQATVVEVRNDDGSVTHVAEGTFAADQLEYLRDNYMESSPYGYGPTEQALIASRLWMRRQGWLLAEYTDGVTPQLIWELPLDATGGATLTPEQRVEWEASVNDELSGQTAERHRSKVGFPGMVPHLMPSVDERYKPEYDLFLLKLMCSFFGVPVSDLGFTETRGLGGSGMHASQAENRADISTDPDLLFMSSLVDRLGHQHQNAPPELLFSFTDNDGGQDESAQASIRVGEISSGQKTLNDGRRELSLPPYPFPEADMPYVLGQGGPVFIEGSLAASRRAQGLGEDGKPLPPGEAPGEQPPAPPGGNPQDGAQGGDNEGPAAARASTPTNSTTKAAAGAPPLCRQIRDQLAPDYPPDATMWVKDANWTGPVDVPPSRIDFDDAKSWDAAGDGAKVAKFRKLLRAGKLKPAVAVTVPGDDRVKIIDGHHRALAARAEGAALPAYVGAVKTKTGPWSVMHAKQHADATHGDMTAAPVSAPPASDGAVKSWPGPHEPSADARAEIGAYHRWATKATTGGRAFRMEHATPDDFPDGVPAGIEFADWIWISTGGDDLVKAYEPWWPRDSKGKWIKRGSFAGLEDKIRKLHDKRMAERDRLDVRIGEHGDRLRAAEARALTGDRAAHVEASTHRARIAELKTERDKAERRRKGSAADVLAKHEAEQRKVQRDANRATVGTMEDTRNTVPAEHVQAVRDAYRQVDGGEGDWVSIADIRDRTPQLTRDQQDAAMMHLLDHQPGTRIIPVANTKALTNREWDAAINIGGEGNHVIRMDAPRTAVPTDPVADMRAAYARIAQPGQWTSLADLRDATPHLTRAEQDMAFKRIEQMDDANVVPESNQKALSERERAGAVVIGDQPKHMLMIGGPSLGGEPIPSGTPAAHVQAIREAYGRVAPRPGAWVPIADLREATAHLTREQQDAALRRLDREPDVHLTPENDQSALTDRERSAAINFGGQPNHRLKIGGPSLGGAPPVAHLRDLPEGHKLRQLSNPAEHDRIARQAAREHLTGAADAETDPEMRARLLSTIAELDRRDQESVGSTPVSMTAPSVNPSASEGPPSEVVGAKLRGVTSTAEAREYLDGLKLKAPQLRQLARDLDVPVRSSDSKAEIHRAIVEGLVGFRTRSDVIERVASRGKAAGGDDPGKAPAPQAGAPQPPADDRWPGWVVDLAIATAGAAALIAALTRGLDIRAVARAAARRWPDAAPSATEVVGWLGEQYGTSLAAALTPAVEDVLAQGYLVGERSATAILDAGVNAREPGGITISVDWSHWRPGDARAARQILSADGKTVELANLLARAGVTIKGIAAQRLDELAAVLADGLERGASPKEIATALRGIVANPSWANTVAWTETARAQGAAASEVYRQRGVSQNEWMTARDQRVCPLCAANDAAGPTVVGTPFPSGDVHPPGHPRCRCALIPVLDDLGKSARSVATGHDQLHHYWTRGEGLAKWADAPHPFRALREHLAKFPPFRDNLDYLNRTVAQWYHDVFHRWPGEKHGKG